MNRFRKLWRETLRPWWFDYEWPVIGVIAAVVVVLGCIGFRLKFLEENLMAGPNGQKPIESLDLVFRSVQLFVLQISVDPPMPWTRTVPPSGKSPPLLPPPPGAHWRRGARSEFRLQPVRASLRMPRTA